MAKFHRVSIISLYANIPIIFTSIFIGCAEPTLPKPYAAPNNVKIQLRKDIVFLTAAPSYLGKRICRHLELMYRPKSTLWCDEQSVGS